MKLIHLDPSFNKFNNKYLSVKDVQVSTAMWTLYYFLQINYETK